MQHIYAKTGKMYERLDSPRAPMQETLSLNSFLGGIGTKLLTCTKVKSSFLLQEDHFGTKFDKKRPPEAILQPKN